MGEGMPQESMNIILENLNASNAEMMTKIDDGIIATTDPEQKLIEENIIQQPVVDPTLTSDEQARYRNIGKELFSPILKALDNVLKKDKKKNNTFGKAKGDNDKKGGLDGKSGKQTPAVQGGGKPGGLDNLMNVDFEKILGFANDISGEIFSIVLMLGIGAMGFLAAIGGFFSSIWDWLGEFFAPIKQFFDLENGPLGTVVSMITGAFEGLWKLVKGAFSALAAAGTWIWNGMKKIFETFITGPNGIISFGTKIVKGIVNFASNAFRWVGELLGNVILGPIKDIFGGAKEDAQKTGRQAAADTKVEANALAQQQRMAAEAFNDKAILSQEEANKNWAAAVAKTREEAVAQAKQVGVKTNNDGTISADAIKTKMAEDMLKRVEDKHGKLKDEERARMMETIKDNIKINGNKLEINNKALTSEMQKTAKTIDDASKSNSDVIDALVSGSDNLYNEVTQGLSAQGKGLMDIYVKANAANEFNAKTEEQQFLQRMEEAKQRGLLAEFRIAEARSMIILAVETIKNTFNGFKTTLIDAYSQLFSSFVDKIKNSVVVNVLPEWVNDYSSNNYNINHTANYGKVYNIMPIDKKDFKDTVSELTTLAQTNVDMVSKQNAVLDEIKIILAEGADPSVKIAIQKELKAQFGEDISIPNDVNNSSEKMNNKVSEIGQSLRSKLYTSVSSALD